MNEYESIELEGKEYIIITEVKVDNMMYVYLVNHQDPKDICIRKVINKDGIDTLEKALKLFEANHNN